MTRHPHPWRELRRYVDVVLHWRHDMPPDTLGLTVRRRVWLAAGQSQVQGRCTIAHERVHLDRGHDGCQPSVVEESVRREVARWLIPDVRALADAMAWGSGDVDEAADELWVTSVVLRDRLRWLHPAERAFVAARLEDVRASA